jgi:hypothetical protein
MRSNIRVLVLCLVGGVLASAGFHVTGAIADSFTDVGPEHVFTSEIDWLTDYDIALGFDDGTFKPLGNIRRQQAALWFANFSDQIHLVHEQTDPGAATNHVLQVDCPGDERVVGGGGFQTAPVEMALTDSYPIDDNTWYLRWTSLLVVPVNPTDVQGWALCMPRVATPGG